MKRLTHLATLTLALALLAAGAVRAQVPTADEIVAACGGYRIEVAAASGVLDAEAAGLVADVLATRLPERGGFLTPLLDIVRATGDGTVEVLRAGTAGDDLFLAAFLASGEPLSLYLVVDQTADAPAAEAVRQMTDPANGDNIALLLPPLSAALRVVSAQAAPGDWSGPEITIELDATGAGVLGRATADHIGSRLALVLGDRVLTAPTVQTAIPGGVFVISGAFEMAEAEALASAIREGALTRDLVALSSEQLPPGGGLERICSALGP